MGSRVVVVGTDGTRSSTAAVRWAAREAVRRDALLRIICAYDRNWEVTPSYGDGETIDVSGSIADATTVTSRHAQLVVVGTHGHGTLSGTLLGSVGLELLHHAGAPVMIARERGER